MSWLFDHIPWYVWLLIAGGGGGAILALVPGALALVLGVWNMLPGWARWTLGGAVVAGLAYFKGRNTGRDNAEAEQKRVDDKANVTAIEVNKRVDKLPDTEVDKALEKDGGFRDDPPSRNPPARRKP